MIIFTTPRNLEILAAYPNWIMDGTFYVCPKIFYQSYSIHAVIDNVNIPLVFVLLPDKKQTSYEFVFKVLCEVIDVDYGIVMMDFEIAAMKAVI